jgi:hypothetical protein
VSGGWSWLKARRQGKSVGPIRAIPTPAQSCAATTGQSSDVLVRRPGGTFTSLDGPGGSARWQRGRNAWQAARHVLGHLTDE